MLVTALVLQVLMFWLKVEAFWNMAVIVVTCDTFQPVMFGLPVELANAKDRSVTVLGSAAATLSDVDEP
jgi:hypothetical protein